MSEKIGYGEERTKTVVRTPVIKFSLIRWNWETGKPESEGVFDLTPFVYQFNWMKSTRNPDASCTITMIPQYSTTHMLDYIRPMDVIEIREFDTLKYQGFVRRVAGSGAIASNGAPQRSVTVTCSSFGALFSEGQLGINMFLKSGTSTKIKTAIEKFSGTFADLIKGDKPYSELVVKVIDAWLGFLDDNGAVKYKNYFNSWINYKDGMGGKRIPGVPKSYTMFYGTEQQVSLWSVLSKMIEVPFTEAWFDVAPRKVWVERNDKLSPPSPSEISLTEEKNHLIIRSPPYNGTVIGGQVKDLWDSLTSRKVPLSYLTRFDLNKTMDESYSFYMVSPALYNPGELALVATGQYEFDATAFDKYLYRPMAHDLYFTRIQIKDSTKVEDKKIIADDIRDKALTLKNWNTGNDEYLSGAFTFMVPSNPEHDPRIGDKIDLEGIDGAYFYVEGVSHSWTYGGALTSNVSVTRGWGDGKPIELKDRIFKRGKFTTGKGFA